MRALVGAAAVAALLLAPAAQAATKAPAGQYRGTIADGGGKIVIDVDSGVVDTFQAYVPFTCTGGGQSGTGEMLLENLSVKVKRTAQGRATFTLKTTQDEQNGNAAATIKGTWNKGATKVTGTITLAASAYAQECEPGTPGQNGPVAFSAKAN